MSYLDGLYLDSFQITKRHSYDGYSKYIAIFSSILQGVYPAGVTEVQSYLCDPLSDSHQTCTEIHFNECFKCNKFQLDQSTHLYFMAECAKRKNPKLWPVISRKWLGRFSSNFVCRLPYHVDTSVPNLFPIG